MEYEVRSTAKYERWFSKIKDNQAKAAIAVRLTLIETIGHFGNSKMLGGGLSELKIDVGQGYRVYYTIKGNQVVFLLAGGIKKSQQADIKEARKLLEELK